MTLKRRRFRIGLLVVAVVPFLWSIGASTAIAWAGSPQPEAAGDVAVVLGAAVWGDKPSPVFQARIDHAIELYRRGRVKRLLCTGGLAEGDTLSEGEAARRYAIRKGVPGSAILVESESRSTSENLSNAGRMMDREGLRTAVIVSDPYHLCGRG